MLQTSFYILWPLIFSSFINLCLVLVAWFKRRESSLSKVFIFFLSLTFFWGLFYIFEILCYPLGAKIFWANLQFVFIVFLPLVWLNIILRLTGNRPLRSPLSYLIYIVSISTIIVAFTDPWHHFFRGAPDIINYGNLTLLAADYNFWHNFIFLPLFYTLLLASFFVLVNSLRYSNSYYRPKYLLLLFAVLLPLASGLLYTLGIEPFVYFNPATMFFGLSSIMLFVAIFRFQLLDILPITRLLLFNNIQDAILVLDTKNRLIDFNKKAREILDLNFKKDIGRLLSEVLEKKSPLLNLILGDKEKFSELSLLPGGSGAFFEVRLSPIYDWQRNYSGKLVLLHNINHRKALEKKLENSLLRQTLISQAASRLNSQDDSPENLEQILNGLGSYISVSRLSLWEDFSDGRLSRNNKEWLARGASSQKELRGQVAYSALPSLLPYLAKHGFLVATTTDDLPDDLKSFFVARGAKSVAIFPLESINQRFGFLLLEDDLNSHLWRQPEIELMRAVSHIISNFLERSSILERVLEERDKMNALISSIGEGVLAVDENNLITSFNYAASEISGYKETELLGKPYRDYLKFVQAISGEEEDIFEDLRNVPLLRRFSTKKLFLVSKKGEKIPVVLIISPLKNEQGGENGFVVTLRDLSKEKELDRIKSEFVSVASHQLRTPLTGIKWFAEMLLENEAGRLNEEQKSFAQEIYQSNERMIKLVNDLLNISHIETGKKFVLKSEKFNFIPLIDEILKDSTRLIKDKNLKIKLNNWPTVFWLWGDRIKIRQAVGNLIDNAFKYSHEGGLVEIGLESSDDKEAVFCVKDQGIGVPLRQQKDIFDKFFRADNAYEKSPGSGLGLYIALELFEASGGRLWFNSVENKGSSFYFSLPLAPKE